MEKSHSIINISKALLSFQENLNKIGKDSINPFFKNKYASLPHIQECIQEPLAASGLTYSQHPEGVAITTILIHAESGEYFSSQISIHAVPDYLKEKDNTGTIVYRGATYITPQSNGSAITYAKRYALIAILGLNIDDDDDGNAGSGRSQQPDKLSWLNPGSEQWTAAIKYLNGGGKIENIEAKYRISKENREHLLTDAV